MKYWRWERGYTGNGHKLTPCKLHVVIQCFHLFRHIQIWVAGTLHVNTVLHACQCKYLPPLLYIDSKHPAVTEDHIISLSPHHHQGRVGYKVTIRVMKADRRMVASRSRPARTTTCYSCPHLQMKNVSHGGGAGVTL